MEEHERNEEHEGGERDERDEEHVLADVCSLDGMRIEAFPADVCR